ncbi:hypothetical protein PR202_ga14853 [Eleusine coracana subsp. coracana]|uniref:Cytochrome P450 n=1 Tax=Eleusine coracana subsp. coracana TaxID=191504 RepID=A0AAV5CIS1_ELECO|nr:hypothetical protein PR202_ga14853 [Eleusine coracana subsp. coracana]
MLFTAELRRAFAAHGKVSDQALGELRYLHLEPCRVLGYDVPRGTTTLMNVWPLGLDERYWPGDPDEFRPERFEAEDVADVDFKGADFELLPFGAVQGGRQVCRCIPGTLYLRHWRRMCPGIGFGVANVKVALASFLFHFDWEAPAELDITESFGITVHRKSDLTLRPIQRMPVSSVRDVEVFMS